MELLYVEETKLLTFKDELVVKEPLRWFQEERIQGQITDLLSFKVFVEQLKLPAPF